MRTGDKICGVLVWTVFTFFSCTEDLCEGTASNSNQGGTAVQQWIYDMMSQWYLWNEDVKQIEPDYSLRYDDFFYSLLSTDRSDGKHTGNSNYFYSHMVRSPAYTRASQFLDLGYGFEFNMVPCFVSCPSSGRTSENIFCVVTYVYKDTPAWNAGLRRGMYIEKVNGTKFTRSNFETLYPLLLPESYSASTPRPVEVSWCEIADTGLKYNGANGTYRTGRIYNRRQDVICPVYVEYNPLFHYDVINTGSGRVVGYLVYNSFDKGVNNLYDDALKRVMDTFANAGVNEFVLDLRYNSGGYISSCQLLASMLAPRHKLGTRFKHIVFNKDIITKRGPEEHDFWLHFLHTHEMRSSDHGTGSEGVNLDLSRIYVLCSGETAAASEVLISGLRGAGVEVIHIGMRTEGKNVGMRKVGPSMGDGGLFGNYCYELWPVAFHWYNAREEGGSDTGFEPDINVNEYEYIGWKELGDSEEILLNLALQHIDNGHFTPGSRSSVSNVNYTDPVYGHSSMTTSLKGALL